MPWPPKRSFTPEERSLIETMKAQQTLLRSQLIIRAPTTPIRLIAGCDSAFLGEDIFSVFVVFEFESLRQVEVVSHLSPTTLPYIPGYLAFREVPNLLLAYQKLQHKPNLIMVDGHGIMHPRRMGIASHLGVTLGIPTIGVAKKKLVGTFDPPGPNIGDMTFVTQKGETLGVALRSKSNVKPIFVSPGHLCDVDTAVNLTLATLRGYKLPEPTRIADKYSKELKPDTEVSGP